MLEPNEEFTQLSLSAGKPKRANLIRSLALLLGPDFCSDIINVETSDHARLQIELSYNWYFDVKTRDDAKEASKLFSVPDFIGDLCKAIASRYAQNQIARYPKAFKTIFFCDQSKLQYVCHKIFLKIENLSVVKLFALL